MIFADRYPKAEPFMEPMEGIYVTPDYYPCAVCEAPTRFIDYMAHKPAPLCSDECAIKHHTIGAVGRSL